MTSKSNVKVNIAEFYERDSCITCDSKLLRVLDKGLFGDEPHRSMFLDSPWGESPLPYLQKCEYILVECENCKQVFHKRVLNSKWQERRFKDWMTADAIHRFEEMHSLNSPLAIFNKSITIIDHLLCLEKLTRPLRKPDERLRILDFGCGWGKFIDIGEKLGFETYGIDAHAARRSINGKRKIFASFKDFDLKIEKPMHVITLFQVLEHLDEPKKTLQQAFKHLVPSGILILEVPNCSKITKIKKQEDLIISGIDHINAFTPKTLTKIAKLSGFTQIRQPIAHVSADYKSIIKREIKRYLRYFLGSSTDQYFKRL
jgi:2-polyprenyl-3-methyl-5-hydroxy-6-metoxy-1,4-benzoquinol methylase